MLGYIKELDLRKTFHNMNIGKISYCDVHRKVNENKYPYSYVFFNVELYNTFQSKRFVTELNKQYIIKLIYDEEAGQYWEVKKHVNKELREKTKPANTDDIPVFYLEEKKDVVVPSSNNKDIEANNIEEVDETECNNDYDIIMSQIYNKNTREYYYNLWENKYDLWTRNTITL